MSLAQAESMLAMVTRACATVGAGRLTVKVHPEDRSDVFATLDPSALIREGDAATAIEAASVVVVSTSTAGFEACALDRPVIVLAPGGVDPPPEYSIFGAALVVRDERELADALRSVSAGDDAALGSPTRPGPARRGDVRPAGYRLGGADR